VGYAARIHRPQGLGIKSSQAKPNQTKPNQTKSNQIKPNQTKAAAIRHQV
jgi:hypothetical protein